MILPRDTAMAWNGTRITEHNRGPINVTEQKIKKSARMVNGDLRENVITVKSSYSISWDMVPSTTEKTVDGYLGGKGILDFARDTHLFTLTLRYDDVSGAELTKTVVFSSDPTYEVIKRSPAGFDLVNVSVELEEV
jgi:hypothetical protein